MPNITPVHENPKWLRQQARSRNVPADFKNIDAALNLLADILDVTGREDVSIQHRQSFVGGKEWKIGIKHGTRDAVVGCGAAFEVAVQDLLNNETRSIIQSPFRRRK